MMERIRRASAEMVIRVRWLSVAVVLLCLSAIIWTLLSPPAWTSAVVLVGAAIPLAILGRDSPR